MPVDINAPDLGWYLSLVRRWAWLAVLSAVVAGVTAFAYSTHSRTTSYSATATLLIQPPLAPGFNAGESLYTASQWAQMYSQLSSSAAMMVKTQEKLATQYPPAKLAAAGLSSTVKPNSQFLELTAHAATADVALSMADIGASTFTAYVGSLQQQRFEEVLQSLQARVDANTQKMAATQTQLALLAAKKDTLDPKEYQKQEAALQGELKAEQDLATQLQDNSTSARIASVVQQPSVNVISLPVAAAPMTTPVRWTVLMAAAFGLLLAVGTAAAAEVLRDRPRSVAGIAGALGADVLASIPKVAKVHEQTDYAAKYRLIEQQTQDAYRMLRTNLRFRGVGNTPVTVLVTSARPGEGKSMTIAGLADAFANDGKRVIVVDGDLRKPMQHRIFQADNAIGLTTVLRAPISEPNLRLQLRRAIGAPVSTGQQPSLLSSLRLAKVDDEISLGLQQVGLPSQGGGSSVVLYPSGPPTAGSTELLSSQRMAGLLSTLKAAADVVLVDSLPVLVAADALVLASLVDGIVVAVDPAETPLRDLTRTSQALERVREKLLGIVLTKVDPLGAYYYYRYYAATEETEPNAAATAPAKRQERLAN